MTIEVYKRAKGVEALEIIGLDDEFKAGDLCWLETPLNPTGEARCVPHCRKATSVSSYDVPGISSTTLTRCDQLKLRYELNSYYARFMLLEAS